jgi:glycerol kinase
VCAHARLEGVDVPIAGIAGDQQAALFGQACHAPGLAKNTYGTGCFMLMNTGREAVASKNNLVTTVAWQRDGTTDYALEGSVFIAGAVVQWLRDGLGVIRQSADVEALASTVEVNGGVYFVPAFAGLGAPHWDAYARGAMFGLTRGATAGHIARAALESIAYQSADVLAAMERDGIEPPDAVPGGPARRAGRAPAGARDDRTRRRVPRGARRGLLEGSGGSRRQLAGRSPLRAGDVARPGRCAARGVGQGCGAREALGGIARR